MRLVRLYNNNYQGVVTYASRLQMGSKMKLSDQRPFLELIKGSRRILSD